MSVSGDKMEKRFLLIRHGQSEGNIGKPAAYRGSPPLTELGWEQVRQAAQAVTREPDLIVATSFIRAKQSAEPLRERYPNAAYEIWPAHEYTPLADHYYRGKSMPSRKQAFLDFFDLDDPDYYDGDGAETFAEGIARADDIWRRLRESEYREIVVFTHATFLRMMYWRWLLASTELATKAMYSFGRFRSLMPVPNASIITGTINADGILSLTTPQTDHLSQ